KGTGAEKMTAGEIVVILISALLFGFFAGSSALEAQTAVEVLVYFILIILISGFVSLKGIREITTKRIALFLSCSGVVVIVAYIVYYIIFGGLIEPSEWM
ncbi:MAG: hypothetical protein P8Y09_10990, partial [Deltaproteobacteria bacterium]